MNKEIDIGSFSEKKKLLLEVLLQKRKKEFGADSIIKAAQKSYYHLSSAQKRMYIMSQINPDNISYNVNIVLCIYEKINIDRMKQAFQKLILRHEMLRTCFKIIDGVPVQCIQEDFDFSITITKKDNENELINFINTFIQPFDLVNSPLLRVSLIEMEEDKWYLLLDTHHIVADAYSLWNLLGELFILYTGEQPAEQILQYRDFSEWQNKLLRSNKIRMHEEYWMNRLGGKLPILYLPYDFPRPPVFDSRGETIPVKLESKITENLYMLQKKYNTTVFTILTAILNVLLMKYSGQDDIIVGTAVNGRAHADTETIIGMFVNMLPIRNSPTGEKSFNNFLNEVKQTLLDAFEHQDYQFEVLLEKLNIQRDISRNPIYDVMFTMQNLENMSFENSNMNIVPFMYKDSFTHADINILAFQRNNEILLNFEYSTSLFKRESIIRMGEHFKKIIEEVLADERKRLYEIEMLTEEEQQEEIWKYNETGHLCSNRNVIEMIEEQAKNNGTRTAVEDNGVIISYAELDEEAGKLGSFLQERGIGKGSIVGICLERSAEFMVSVLGVQKAGGIYLPIDTGYPEERIRYMLADSGASMVLSREKWKDKLPEEIEVIVLEQKNWRKSTYKKAEKSDGEDLVYVMYTSGTTGQPKGAMITHKGLQNYVEWAISQYTEGEEVFPLYTSISFDLTVTSMYVPLVSGGKIVVYREEGHENLIERIQDENYVTVMKTTPTHLKLLNKEKLGVGSKLKKIIVGGEAFKTETARNIDEASEGRVSLYNEYGPTETVVGCMIYKYDRKNDQRATVPIGKPIWNSSIYLMDKGMKAVVRGVAGEIYIGGRGVGKGYIGKEKITKEKFVEDPYRPGEMLYKSGDLGIRLENGDIEYVGRIDKQVKIRGYRIELEEIESVILKNDSVKDVVVVTDDENISLYAYVIPGEGYQKDELKAYLREELPGYMIPGRIIQVEELPVTRNGKVDKEKIKNRLPEEANKLKSETANRTEEKLKGIWEEILQTEGIGMEDDFFDLGGHSLKVNTLINEIHRVFKKEIPFSSIFEAPTIRELASYIEKEEKTEYLTIKKAEEKDYYVASPAQQRMYALDKMIRTSVSYNAPMVFWMEELEEEKLKKVFEKLTERHESFRTSFVMHEEKIIQKIEKSVEVEIDRIIIREEEIEESIEEFIQPFDLRKAPLIRVMMAEVEDRKKKLLVLDMHHIIVDGVSTEILVEEFRKLYEGEELEEPMLQYRDYSEWQRKEKEKEELRKQEAYWKEQLGGELPVLNLGTDYVRPANQSFEGGNIWFKLNKKETEAVKKAAQEHGVTLYIWLLGAFYVLLHKYSGQEDIIVGTPMSGRRHAELEKIIGLFVNTLAIRNRPHGEKTYEAFIREVRESVLNGQENQDVQFEDLIQKLELPRDPRRNPVFDTMYVMQSMDIDKWKKGKHGLEPYPYESKSSKMDLLLNTFEIEGELEFLLEYSTALFRKETIERLEEHYKRIIKEVTENPEKKLKEIEIISNGNLIFPDRVEGQNKIRKNREKRKEQNYMEEESEAEKELLKLWMHVLKAEAKDIDTEESFFDLGGNSISVITLVAYINEKFKDIQLNVVDVFTYSSIKKLAEYIEIIQKDTSIY